ncbi:MAG TPA: ribosome maturation factor RimM, partial [Acidobacteriaceae bacterium]|nr:ribosome maturation factor RimM [Acidobacteriaceae bacterium]
MTSSSDWVVLAQIVRPQGRHGELLAEILTDFPESFSQRRRLFLRPGSEAGGTSLREAKLENHWFHKDRVVLKLAGVDSINDAETLRGFEVVLPIAERMPLTGDALYVSDLVGMHVIDVGGGGMREAGEIIDVLPEGA